MFPQGVKVILQVFQCLRAEDFGPRLRTWHSCHMPIINNQPLNDPYIIRNSSSSTFFPHVFLKRTCERKPPKLDSGPSSLGFRVEGELNKEYSKSRR